MPSILGQDNVAYDNDNAFFANFEVPVVLGVAVVGLLLGCVLYHMCYRRFCTHNRPLSVHIHRRRAQRRAEERRINSVVSTLFRRNAETGNAGQHSSDSLPDYDDLPPSYTNFAPKTKTKRGVGSQTTAAEEPPPPYEDLKTETRRRETTL